MSDDKNEGGLRPRVEKVFFASGDLVVVKHEVPNRPTMIVQSIDKMTMPKKQGEAMSMSSKSSALLGITCIWFATDMSLQVHRFNTKDIKKKRDD